MKSSTEYEYLSKSGGAYKKVYSPDNPQKVTITELGLYVYNRYMFLLTADTGSKTTVLEVYIDSPDESAIININAEVKQSANNVTLAQTILETMLFNGLSVTDLSIKGTYKGLPIYGLTDSLKIAVGGPDVSPTVNLRGRVNIIDVADEVFTAMPVYQNNVDSNVYYVKLNDSFVKKS